MAALAPTLNFFGVLSESKRIISAHSRHFLALSVLFLLPLSFSLIIYPTLQAILSDSQSRHIQILLGHTQNVQNTPTLDPDSSLKSLALPLTFTLFVFLLSISAAATITYSTYHGFYGRPVKLAAAVKSLLHSFIPLLLTTITSQSLMALVCASFGLFLVLITKSVEILGFEIDYSSNYFLWFCIAISIISASVLAYLHVNWSLACVVVVVESRWGLEALRRSNYLVKGMRTISLSLLLCFGAAIGFSVWVNSATGSVDLGDFRKCLAFILRTVVGSSFVTVFELYRKASTTVLYMYCKALRGELAWEIAEEFAREYVSLPFDDAKAPHVVFVSQTS